MDATLESLQAEALQAFASAPNEPALIQVKARFLGRKGELTAQMKRLAQLGPDEKRSFGAALNKVKESLEAACEARLAQLNQAGLQVLEASRPDLSLPGRRPGPGRLHPIAQIQNEIEDAFLALGFDVCEGPDTETEWYNFDALNMPDGHPARDMQDTFYLGSGLLLRTHTSPVQIRTMLAQDPPLRMIAPGAVYRSDYDITHSPMFHQVEGLLVDDRVSMADLKGILLQFCRKIFHDQVDVRFRASFFPFTEPSAEVDMLCFQCLGRGCRLCKGSGWIEIGGCGMVNPEVFRQVGRMDPSKRDAYDPERIQGFAFGMGIERITMLKLGLNDIRLLFENDLRLIHQF